MAHVSLTDFILAILVIIGACIGGYWSYRGSHDIFSNQLQNEKKNIAKAISLDLKTIKEESRYFSTAYFFYTTDSSTLLRAITQDFKPYIPPDQLYNKETGLYLLYKRDITKLNYDLAGKIYNFSIILLLG